MFTILFKVTFYQAFSLFLYALCRSSDGHILAVSSTDGYCSLVSFAEGELGTPYVGKKNRDSVKHESIVDDTDKVTELVSTEDIEMENVSTEPCREVLEESTKCDKSPGSNMPLEQSKKEEGVSKAPAKAPEESGKKPEEECSKPPSNEQEEPPKKQEKDEKHEKTSIITEKTPQKQQVEKKPSSDILQEPPKKQITARRAGDRCAVFQMYYR